MADRRELVLSSHEPLRVRTRAAGVFLFLPLLADLGFDTLVRKAGYPGTEMVPADAAVLATVRTAVLGASALALGFLGRVPAFREAHRLVYPLLVAGGIKLAIEDFPQGRAVTLFVALAIYGGALILTPRIARSST